MKKDPASTKFWLELTGLTTLLYVSVLGGRPIAYGRNASLVKTADPYSTLVLSPLMMEVFRLQVILICHPVGQERDYRFTNRAPYAWSAATTNFVKQKKI
jgi:hypothetical protein